MTAALLTFFCKATLLCGKQNNSYERQVNTLVIDIVIDSLTLQLTIFFICLTVVLLKG